MGKRRIRVGRIRETLAGLRADLSAMLALPDAGAAERIRQARSDFESFCRTYFPHQLRLAPSGFHKWVFAESGKWGPGLRLALAAPRGNAKTTLLARLYPLWRIVRNDTRFVAVISDSAEQAVTSLEVIKAELAGNARLIGDFPQAAGRGGPWRAGDAVTAGGVRIRAYGSGMRIRGANHMGFRPDLVILDDLENDESVRNRVNRDRLQGWFDSAVLRLGPPDDSGQFLLVGTMLHTDGLLARVCARPDFTSRTFKALVRPPERMALWEEWERLYLSDRDLAAAFYADRAEVMNQGAEVLWPEVQPLYALMRERALSRAAFASEMQNEPLDAASRIFRPEMFSYYETPPDVDLTVGAVDLALGRAAGDFTAMIVLGRDSSGRVCVLEADIDRVTPAQAVGRIIELQARHNCARFAVEEVAFQEFFKQVLLSEARTAGVPIPAVGFRPRSAKAVRIESLAPHIASGNIVFDRRHGLLLDQLLEYPKSAHDDGPDALHMAFSLLNGSGPIEFRASRARPDRSSRGF